MSKASSTTPFKAAICLLFIAFFLLFPSLGRTAESLEVTANQLRVYEKPDLLGRVVAILPRSMKIVAASQATGNFRKILYFDHGQRRFGWAAVADLRTGARTAMAPPKGMGVQGRAVNPYYKPRGLHNSWAGGIKVGINYQTQGAKTYTDGQGNSADVSAMSGTSSMFEGFIDVPMSSTFTIEGYLQLKNTSGTATGSPSSSLVGTQALNITLQETFLSVGALARVYSNPSSNFWFGGGLQIDHGSSGTLQLGSNAATSLQGSDLQNFFMLYAAAGYDFPLAEKFVLVDDLRLGAVINTSPPIIEVDVLVGVAYKF